MDILARRGTENVAFGDEVSLIIPLDIDAQLVIWALADRDMTKTAALSNMMK